VIKNFLLFVPIILKDKSVTLGTQHLLVVAREGLVIPFKGMILMSALYAASACAHRKNTNGEEGRV
jgi:hypothetical protein